MKKLSKKRISSQLRLASLTVFVGVCLFPLTAMAEGETSISRLSSEVMNVLIPVFVAFIGALATWALNKLQKKTGLQVSEASRDAWENLAKTAALRGGEWARKKSKDLADGKKVPGGEVMEVAANWAIDMGKNLKLPELGRERLEGLIEAHLFGLRESNEI